MGKPVRTAVIMAGGTGERFWPMSRQALPKQMLAITESGETLLQEAVTRILPLLPEKQVFVATSLALRDIIAHGDERVPNGNVLAEPEKRNTSGAIAWAAANLMARYGEPESITMAILTADHLIGEHDAFRRTIDAAMSAAEHLDALVTIGVPPTRPDTAFGYIEPDMDATVLDIAPGVDVRPVHRFREKPNQQTAEQFVSEGHYLWNSGMFFWRVSAFLEELEHASPELAVITRSMAGALREGKTSDAERFFSQIESISIDYALMEHARKVYVARSLFSWDDVGSWDAFGRARPLDEKGNVATGDPVLIDVEDSIVLNEAGTEKCAVGVVGLDNIVVITTGDAVLVVPKDRVQDVRKIVKELKARGAGQV